MKPSDKNFNIKCQECKFFVGNKTRIEHNSRNAVGISKKSCSNPKHVTGWGWIGSGRGGCIFGECKEIECPTCENRFKCFTTL
jgi:hypothetical protein